MNASFAFSVFASFSLARVDVALDTTDLAWDCMRDFLVAISEVRLSINYGREFIEYSDLPGERY